MEFITLRPLVVPLLRLGAIAQGLRVINSVDPCILKSNYYIATLSLCSKVLPLYSNIASYSCGTNHPQLKRFTRVTCM